MAPAVTMGIIPVPMHALRATKMQKSDKQNDGSNGRRRRGIGDMPPVHPLDGTNKDNNGGLGSGSSGSGIPITVTGGVMEDEDVGFPLDDPTVVQDPRNGDLHLN